MGSLLDMDMGGGNSNTSAASSGWNQWGGGATTAKDFTVPDYQDCLPNTQPGQNGRSGVAIKGRFRRVADSNNI